MQVSLAIGAETREALRLDLIPHGEAPTRIATPAQREAIRMAGPRAREAGNPLAAR